MNMNIVWTGWFCSWVLAFAGFESYAVMTERETLSQFVRQVSADWPPIIFALGLLVGGLVVHFWWTAKG